MKNLAQKIEISIVGLLLAAVLLGFMYTGGWLAGPDESGAASASNDKKLVDQSALDTARKLAPLAVTPEERQFANQALRLADQDVDLAFAEALRNAATRPAVLNAETRGLKQRLQAAQQAVQTDQAEVTRLTSLSERSPDEESLQLQLQLAQAQLDLDKDEVADAKEDLARAGGDTQATIERMLAEHEAAAHPSGENSAPTAAAVVNRGAATKIQQVEEPSSGCLVAQFRAWDSLRSKKQLLTQALGDANGRAATLLSSHKALEQEVQNEKTEKSSLASHATAVLKSGQKDSESGHAAAMALASVQHLQDDQKQLASLDKRIESEQELGQVYASWKKAVAVRERSFAHGVLRDLLWILIIALVVVAFDRAISRFFADIAPDRRRLLTLRLVLRFATRAVGLLIAVLIIFGPPSQLATALALTGAGLTVALQDFIIAFFGWFVLMGRHGIRVGDWVEINGISGEVIEIGLFRTVLLETGNWNEAGQPTGRKVGFVNSFAIQGHYFNFSTSGQWLWDEIQVAVPAGRDPYPIAEGIRKIIATATEENARLAQEEWQRTSTARGHRTFSAAPELSVRPTGGGINLVARYLTRAGERHAVRARLYNAIVDLLRRDDIAATPGELAAAQASKKN